MSAQVHFCFMSMSRCVIAFFGGGCPTHFQSLTILEWAVFSAQNVKERNIDCDIGCTFWCLGTVSAAATTHVFHWASHSLKLGSKLKQCFVSASPLHQALHQTEEAVGHGADEFHAAVCEWRRDQNRSLEWIDAPLNSLARVGTRIFIPACFWNIACLLHSSFYKMCWIGQSCKMALLHFSFVSALTSLFSNDNHATTLDAKQCGDSFSCTTDLRSPGFIQGLPQMWFATMTAIWLSPSSSTGDERLTHCSKCLHGLLFASDMKPSIFCFTTFSLEFKAQKQSRSCRNPEWPVHTSSQMFFKDSLIEWQCSHMWCDQKLWNPVSLSFFCYQSKSGEILCRSQLWMMSWQKDFLITACSALRLSHVLHLRHSKHCQVSWAKIVWPTQHNTTPPCQHSWWSFCGRLQMNFVINIKFLHALKPLQSYHILLLIQALFSKLLSLCKLVFEVVLLQWLLQRAILDWVWCLHQVCLPQTTTSKGAPGFDNVSCVHCEEHAEIECNCILNPDSCGHCGHSANNHETLLTM